MTKYKEITKLMDELIDKIGLIKYKTRYTVTLTQMQLDIENMSRFIREDLY